MRHTVVCARGRRRQAEQQRREQDKKPSHAIHSSGQRMRRLRQLAARTTALHVRRYLNYGGAIAMQQPQTVVRQRRFRYDVNGVDFKNS
jgi:hypothetical protein